jgi:hypothetical protein
MRWSRVARLIFPARKLIIATGCQPSLKAVSGGRVSPEAQVSACATGDCQRHPAKFDYRKSDGSHHHHQDHLEFMQAIYPTKPELPRKLFTM